MTDLREKVARALCRSDGYNPDLIYAERFARHADIAIKAVLDGLMEPSEEMLADGAREDTLQLAFQAMIRQERARLFPYADNG